MLIGPNDEAKRRGGFGAMLQPSLGKYDGKSFIAAYLELCEEVAKSYANAPNPPALVHVCGGSINGLDPCQDIQTASDKFNKKAVTRMRSYYTTITKAHWHEINKIGGGYLGCDSHYGPKGHAVLAADIAPQLRKILGW